MLTESKLVHLFDMADFSENSPLSEIIADTLRRHGAVELSDDDLEDLAAAGDINMARDPQAFNDDPFGTLLIEESKRGIIDEKRILGRDL